MFSVMFIICLIRIKKILYFLKMTSPGTGQGFPSEAHAGRRWVPGAGELHCLGQESRPELPAAGTHFSAMPSSAKCHTAASTLGKQIL